MEEKDKTTMRLLPIEHKLTEICRPVIEGLGYRLVWLEFKSGILQIFSENPQTGNLSLDECTAITKALSPVLEVEDPISGAYTLEISSPGIDRPLLDESDFLRFLGFEAKIELDDPSSTGQKRYRGKILGAENGGVQIVVDQVEHTIPINTIKKARLVLTDELIKSLAPVQAKPAQEQVQKKKKKSNA